MPEQQPNPNEPADDQPAIIKVPSVVSAGARWLFGQEANTVALFVLIGVIVAGFRYGVPFLVEHGREIHKEVIDAHRQDRVDDRERHKAERDEDKERRTKDLERWSKAIDKQVIVSEETNKTLHELLTEVRKGKQ